MGMAGQRAKGQKLLNFAADEAFIRQIDEAAIRAGHGNRSQFIRDAIFEKLERMGFSIPRELKAAPLRGGTRNHPMDIARQAALRARHLTDGGPPPVHIIQGQQAAAQDAEAAQAEAEQSIAAQSTGRRRRRRG